MSAAEIAVYLGHRKAWQALLDSDAAVALVTEDDLDVIDEPAFRTALSHADDHAGWDILKFFDFRPKRIVHSRDWRGLTIVDYKYPASGCVAYLITRDAACRLLARKRLFRPVDEDLSWCWEHDLRVRSIHPNIVTEISDRIGGSTIEFSRQTAKRNRNHLRAALGVLVAGYKQIRAKRHLTRHR